MKKKIVLSIMLAMAGIASISLVGCDSESAADSVTGSNTGTVAATSISGKVLAEAGGGYTTARICLSGGTCTAPDANGNYSFAGMNVTTHVATKVSARASAAVGAGAVLDTAYIIVGNDTLREIPIYSWSQILPTGYVIQRNAKVVPPARFLGNTIQAVYWTSDSIANVVDLGSASSTSYSGYLYTYYDSAAFANNTILFSWFARVKRNDSVVSYSTIAGVKAHAGDIEVDSTNFKLVTKYGSVKGYSYVPADSSVAVYNATRTTTTDSLEITNSVFGGSAWTGVRPNNTVDTLTSVDSMSLAARLCADTIIYTFARTDTSANSRSPKASGDTSYVMVSSSVNRSNDSVTNVYMRHIKSFYGAYVSLVKSFTSGTVNLNGDVLDSVIVVFNSDTTMTTQLPLNVTLTSGAQPLAVLASYALVHAGYNRIALHPYVGDQQTKTITGIELTDYTSQYSTDTQWGSRAVNYTNVHVWFKFKN